MWKFRVLHRQPAPPTAQTTSPAEPPSPPEAPLILLAEDNETNIETTTHYLEAKGYRLLLAFNGTEAVAIARTQKPDLILMDIQMPGIDGLEAIQQIRQDPDNAVNSIPIIALTALVMTGDRDRCLQAGANEYLGKPVKLKVLTTKIRALLATTPR
jgi:CheY-like chemotaxis protein